MANCTNKTELFYSDNLDEIAEAKQLCQTCPNQTPCSIQAVENFEQYGIWAGMDRIEIKRARRIWKRSRGALDIPAAIEYSRENKGRPGRPRKVVL